MAKTVALAARGRGGEFVQILQGYLHLFKTALERVEDLGLGSVSFQVRQCLDPRLLQTLQSLSYAFAQLFFRKRVLETETRLFQQMVAQR